MKRTPIKRRKPPAAEAKLLREFAAEFPRCFVCGGKYMLQVHHILGGPNRKNVRCNLTILCTICHLAYHSGGPVWWFGAKRPPLRLGHILCVKWLMDPIGTDWEQLAEIRQRALPEDLPLPEWYVRERERNGL